MMLFKRGSRLPSSVSMGGEGYSGPQKTPGALPAIGSRPRFGLDFT